MSIAGWLQQRKQKRREKAIAKHKKHIKNKFGYGDDRQRAMGFFKELGGAQGIAGLLERFMVNIDHSIRDEEEKEQVYQILISFGPEAVPVIEEYINRKDASRVPVTWPLKVLNAVSQPEEVVTVILRSLQRMGTEYSTDPERKTSLVSQLAELPDPRVVPALMPFLHDHRDEVQLEALSGLVRKADEAAREPLLELLIDENTPLRLKAAVAESIKKLGWDVRGYRKKVEEVLPEGLFVDRSGKIKGQWAAGMDQDK
jgi:hypothetical protein